MSESKKEWKVVDGYYPGFLNIVGASYTVSIVTSATDLTLEDYVNRANDAHLMAAAPDLLEALEVMIFAAAAVAVPHDGERKALQMSVDHALKALAKARGQQ
ncbi:MAG: hypothetical protein J6D44_14405 [Pseudomonas sp.]|nr:hypothetical protein [Pseudomonas sp.]